MWQPIETVPKDGTPVFVTSPYNCINGKYSGGVPVVAVWKESKYSELGVWVMPDLSSIYGGLAYCATHWMPIPLST